MKRLDGKSAQYEDRLFGEKKRLVGDAEPTAAWAAPRT